MQWTFTGFLVPTPALRNCVRDFHLKQSGRGLLSIARFQSQPSVTLWGRGQDDTRFSLRPEPHRDCVGDDFCAHALFQLLPHRTKVGDLAKSNSRTLQLSPARIRAGTNCFLVLGTIIEQFIGIKSQPLRIRLATCRPSTQPSPAGPHLGQTRVIPSSLVGAGDRIGDYWLISLIAQID